MNWDGEEATKQGQESLDRRGPTWTRLSDSKKNSCSSCSKMKVSGSTCQAEQNQGKEPPARASPQHPYLRPCHATTDSGDREGVWNTHFKNLATSESGAPGPLKHREGHEQALFHMGTQKPREEKPVSLSLWATTEPCNLKTLRPYPGSAGPDSLTHHLN